MTVQPTCPKCQGVLATKKDGGENESYCLYKVTCSVCGLEGATAMTERFALASFYHDHGRSADQFVGLAKIEKDGGPPKSAMKWRLEHDFYPDAKKQKGKWKLPLKTAEKVVAEWKQRKGMILLSRVAGKCGLKSRSLNPLAAKGVIHADKFSHKWYVSEKESKRLEEYYIGTVTSTEAAVMLSLRSRDDVYKLDLSHYCLNTDLRFSRKMLKGLLASRKLSGKKGR